MVGAAYRAKGVEDVEGDDVMVGVLDESSRRNHGI
jgi:hypothetical protein